MIVIATLSIDASEPWFPTSECEMKDIYIRRGNKTHRLETELWERRQAEGRKSVGKTKPKREKGRERPWNEEWGEKEEMIEG